MCLIDMSREFFKVNVYLRPKNFFKIHELKSMVLHYAVSSDSLSAFFNSYPDTINLGDYDLEFRVVSTFYSDSDKFFYCLI